MSSTITGSEDRMVAGIDIGGTSIKGILSDKNGKVLSFREIPTPQKKADFDQAIAQLVENLATSASVSKIDIEAIGIGSAGQMDRTKGVILTSPNIPALKNHPLAKNIEKITGVRVFLENDATAALVGAWWKGNGNKFRNWVMVTLGTGVGGGAIIDNKIFTGVSGNSMEIGHMTIDYNGRPCSCGNKGCLERYASATALIETVQLHLAEYKESSLHQRIEDAPLTAQMIHEEAQKKDPLALFAMNEIATYLGIGLANVVNILNPEAIILGGGLSEAHKMLIPIIKKVIKERALPGTYEDLMIMPIKDQAQIPALGAIKIALDSLKKD